MVEFLKENVGEIGEQAIEHLWLSGISIFLSCVAGISLGLALTRNHKFAGFFIGVTGVMQTIPSLAMLGFFIPFLGIGKLPAIVALFLYALLPIVRNTYTGIQNIDANIREAAMAMGMTRYQLLAKVEFPLALPVIFAGIRTATVINVGVATLCALIGAGGLGEFIFRGITLNSTPMILAGAIPASILAISLDYGLSLVQKNVRKRLWPFIAGMAIVIGIYPAWSILNQSDNKAGLVAGFNSEFMNRTDGWPGLSEAYDLQLPAVELEITLMYEALKNQEVDVIAGFTTDGRIQSYNLRVLEDDLRYFPPYYAAPIVKLETLKEYPLLEASLTKLDGKIPKELIAYLNLKVDQHEFSIEQAADSLLSSVTKGVFAKNPALPGKEKLVIGSKAFTESYILATFLSEYVETTTGYPTDLKLGFGGTKLLFDAFLSGDIKLYPEYTGTALLVFVQPSKTVIDSLLQSPEKIHTFTNSELKEDFGVVMLPSFGFNNTTALMMREELADQLGIVTISDLKNYIIRFDQ
ncbi:ABC transporter permease/substrate-binding protein [uncultured Imperialibacter sp.]|uniref:ABC transporter permease/substrate-binding protein n=1 Tax=uncultured Imperialibacter sp. TaxID=1672639 RepID=UPI0030D92592|tara:strand:- start:11939 stop:13507 length:1569 start_codon:yes stop_codon:yes gene_type:complete